MQLGTARGDGAAGGRVADPARRPACPLSSGEAGAAASLSRGAG
jgi:hypothetical protein